MKTEPRTLSVGALAALVSLALAPLNVRAQHDEPPPPSGYALQNVTAVDASGAQRSGLTLVVRGSLIETLAPGAPVPGDVRLLDGDSLWIYPGLVDAQGAADFEFQERESEGRTLPWDPPRAAQGFTPHRLVSEALTATGADLDDRRKEGVVASGLHVFDGLAAGQGTALLHRKSATLPTELVVRPSLGPSFSFQSARGVYPGTLFGVMAFHRQVFEDANRQGTIMAEYRRDPTGLAVPRWDPDYEVYRQAAQGRVPVFFRADGAEDIRRALGLADEYGFRPVIVGGGEAWKVTDELRERNVPVLVSLDFPRPTDWKTEDKEEPEEPEEGAEAEEPDEREPEEGVEAEAPGEEEIMEEEEELKPAAWREKQRLENLYSNAGRLSEAGVTFALTSGGGEAKLLEGVHKAMEYGLREEAALRALTTTPAQLLGIPSVIRVNEGMAATFIVTDGPLFEDGTDVAYTFVEGEMEEGDVGGGGEAPAADLSGAWTLEMDSPQGTFEMGASFSQDGNDLSGTVTSPQFGSAPITGGNVSGSDVRFTIAISAGGQSIEIRVRGTIQNADLFTGSSESPFGSSSMTATRGGPGGAP